MKVIFEFPTKILNYIKKEKINIKDLKNKILSVIWEDLLDKNYQTIKVKEVKVVVNYIHKTQINKIFVNPKDISKKKPFREASWYRLLKKYSIHYLIYKIK